MRNTELVSSTILLPSGHYFHREKPVIIIEHCEDKQIILLESRIEFVFTVFHNPLLGSKNAFIYYHLVDATTAKKCESEARKYELYPGVFEFVSRVSSVFDFGFCRFMKLKCCRIVKKNILDVVLNPMRRLGFTEIEMVALKAIIALDPSAANLSPNSASLLAVARGSVQNALYAHLSGRLSPAEATSRFGNLLLLIAGLSVSILSEISNFIMITDLVSRI